MIKLPKMSSASMYLAVSSRNFASKSCSLTLKAWTKKQRGKWTHGLCFKMMGLIKPPPFEGLPSLEIHRYLSLSWLNLKKLYIKSIKKQRFLGMALLFSGLRALYRVRKVATSRYKSSPPSPILTKKKVAATLTYGRLQTDFQNFIPTDPHYTPLKL